MLCVRHVIQEATLKAQDILLLGMMTGYRGHEVQSKYFQQQVVGIGDGIPVQEADESTG